MDKKEHMIELEVRDYECDIQGIVNNSVYQNYLEHARHKYLKSRGVDFASLALEGINLVVIRVELDYKFPLKSGDQFHIYTKYQKESRLKIAFEQEIISVDTGKLVLRAKVIGVALDKKGKPMEPVTVSNIFI